jgi:hypothetical protein
MNRFERRRSAMRFRGSETGHQHGQFLPAIPEHQAVGGTIAFRSTIDHGQFSLFIWKIQVLSGMETRRDYFHDSCFVFKKVTMINGMQSRFTFVNGASAVRYVLQ